MFIFISDVMLWSECLMESYIFVLVIISFLNIEGNILWTIFLSMLSIWQYFPMVPFLLTYRLPPSHLVFQKKKIVTLSPLLQGTLNYTIVNYRVSFGYMLSGNYLALIAFRSHLMESVWRVVVGERKEVARRNGHKEIDTDLIIIPEALTSQLQVLFVGDKYLQIMVKWGHCGM